MKRIHWWLALAAALLVPDVGTITLFSQSRTAVLSQSAIRNMQALKDGQTVTVQMRNVKLAVHLPNGKESTAHILMLREPQSGLYWWRYQTASATATGSADEPGLDYVVYFTGEKAVGFMFSAPVLTVREVQGHQADFNGIQQAAIAEIERNAQAIQDGSVQWVREVNVASKLGRDFMYLAGSASMFPQPKVTTAAHANKQWEVTLEGPNHDFARLTLDDQYMLVGVRR